MESEVDEVNLPANEGAILTSKNMTDLEFYIPKVLSEQDMPVPKMMAFLIGVALRAKAEPEFVDAVISWLQLNINQMKEIKEH